jgi:O-antigen biosynthesis protein
VVHVLSCGVEVCPGWTDAAVRHFCDPDVASVAAVVLVGNDCRTVFSAGLGYRTEGAAWKLAQGREPAEAAAALPYLCGPDTLAGFYRRSALEAIDGFSPWAGDAMTGIDAALALRRAGFRCVLEPECLARVDAKAASRTSSFALGRDAEQLFWRWTSCHGWTRSLVGHAALVVGECVTCLWHPAMIAQLAGRTFGALRVIFSRSASKPVEANSEEAPEVVVAPQLATSRLQEKQPSQRAA